MSTPFTSIQYAAQTILHRLPGRHTHSFQFQYGANLVSKLPTC
jgi:hypothetical protein